MKLSLVLLSVLLVLQLLSASAQPVSDSACPSTTLTHALNHSVLFDQSSIDEKPESCKCPTGEWFVSPEHRQCKADLHNAIVNSSNLTSSLQECQNRITILKADFKRYEDFVWNRDQNYKRNETLLKNELKSSTATFKRILTEANETITSLNTTLNEAKNNITSLNTTLNEAKNNITSLNTTLNEAKTNITSLNNTLNEAKTNITSLNTTLNEAKNDITSLNTTLNETKSNITSLNTELNECTQENQDLHEQIQSLQKELARAKAQIPVNETYQENSIIAFVKTTFNFDNTSSIRWVVAPIVAFAIIWAMIWACLKWMPSSNQESANSPNVVIRFRNAISEKRIKLLKYQWIFKIWQQNDGYIKLISFKRWVFEVRNERNIVSDYSTSDVLHDRLLNDFRKQTMELIENTNEALKKFSTELFGEKLQIVRNPEAVKVFKQTLLQKIEKLRNMMSWVWVFDPTTPMSYDKMVMLILKRPKMANVLQRLCKRIFNTKIFVKQFANLLPSTIEFMERAHKGCKTETGLSLINKEQDSRVNFREARTLIFDALRKARDERKEWIATLYRCFSYTQFTICLVVSVMVLAYTSPYQRTIK